MGLQDKAQSRGFWEPSFLPPKFSNPLAGCCFSISTAGPPPPPQTPNSNSTRNPLMEQAPRLGPSLPQHPSASSRNSSLRANSFIFEWQKPNPSGNVRTHITEKPGMDPFQVDVIRNPRLSIAASLCGRFTGSQKPPSCWQGGVMYGLLQRHASEEWDISPNLPTKKSHSVVLSS